MCCKYLQVYVSAIMKIDRTKLKKSTFDVVGIAVFLHNLGAFFVIITFLKERLKLALAATVLSLC